MLARLALAETQRIRTEIERDGLNNWGRIPSWDHAGSRSPTPPNTRADHRQARRSP
jgi:hypothetical protein